MNILVTGGGGYIGIALVSLLLKKKYIVTVLDNFSFDQQYVFLDLIKNKNLNVINGDVRNKDLLKNLVQKNEFIIPLAGIVGAPACKTKPKLATEINLNQIKNILKFINKRNKIILPVTNSGYGIGEKNKFCTEESPLKPISHYGVTKVKAEKEIRKIKNFISLRLATVFGLSGRIRTDLLVNDFTYRAVFDRKIELFEPNFKRNYIHVKDVARAIMFSIENFKKLRSNVFNIGLETANLSKIELCNLIKKNHEDLKIKINEFTKDPDQRDYIVSNKKILATGWKPRYSLEYGIRELIKCYKSLKIKRNSNI
jgi:nucleoside-diphosphate-sugar epimerase|tara:strand:- start:1772 stop:2707 length:936 start_codon:yes stop_codon:yes gene_type:complete